MNFAAIAESGNISLNMSAVQPAACGTMQINNLSIPSLPLCGLIFNLPTSLFKKACLIFTIAVWAPCALYGVSRYHCVSKALFRLLSDKQWSGKVYKLLSYVE